MPTTKEIALFIALIVFAILFLILIIAFILIWSKRKLLKVEKQRQRELIRVIVQTEETQKAKIANELHDHIIPKLILSALNLNSTINKLENDSGRDFSVAKKEIEAFASLAESIREVAHGIIPKMFTTFGVIKSIEIAVKQLNTINQTTAVFENLTSYTSELPYSMVYQLSIYNASLEILNNLRKHSHYRSLTVTFESCHGFFTFLFAHDGIGITNNEIEKIAQDRKGMGLLSLQSRLIALEAEIDYKKEISISTISLKFPIKNETNY